MSDPDRVAPVVPDSLSLNQLAPVARVNDSRSRNRPSMSDSVEIGKGLVFLLD
jgi:hypothetical protein